MNWKVYFHHEFDSEFESFPESVQEEVYARIMILEEFGAQLGRPYIDTLNGSKHSNMKEMRLSANYGLWRIAFAFDPERDAILLVGGNKRGADKRKFYKKLIKTADARFDDHLYNLKKIK